MSPHPAVPHLAVAALVDRHPELWRAATRHPFLDGVREGTLPAGAFATWLAQDARFVADLLAFQARLLARAPRHAQAVLAGGCSALVSELDWFDGLAERRGLALDVAPLPATREYAELLRRLDAADYPTAVTCLWALERVYLDAWTSARPGAGDHAELVEHWTTPGFAAYVEALAELAASAGGHVNEGLLVDVLRQEAAFWDMALDPDSAASLGATA